MLNTSNMKTMKKAILKTLFIGSIGLVFLACEKSSVDPNDNTNNTTENPTEDNTNQSSDYPNDEAEFNTALYNDVSKTWGNGLFEVLGVDVGFEDCRYDDQITLKSDGTYDYNNGSNLCGEDVASKTGYWESDFINKTITFDKGTADENTAKIIKLTEDNLVVNGYWNGLELHGNYTPF